MDSTPTPDLMVNDRVVGCGSVGVGVGVGLGAVFGDAAAAITMITIRAIAATIMKKRVFKFVAPPSLAGNREVS